MSSTSLDGDVSFLKEQQSSLTCRPETDERTVSDILRRLYQLDPVEVREFTSYADRNYYVKVRRFSSSIDLNDIDDVIAYHLTADDQGCQEYVLKIFNSAYTEGQHLDAEHEMMLIIKKRGIDCPTPVKDTRKKYKSVVSLADRRLIALEGDNGDDNERPRENTKVTQHAVTLLTYVPGFNLDKCAPYTSKILYEYGRLLGSITLALQEYTHPSLLDRKYIWSLDNVITLPSFTSAIGDVARQQMVLDIIKMFADEVLPKRAHFNQGTIHGDFNEQNVLVRRSNHRQQPQTDVYNRQGNANSSQCGHVTPGDKDPQNVYEVVGVVDFGDSMRAPYVYEVAMATAYAMLDCDDTVVDPVSAGGHVLAGYLSSVGPEGQLTALERSMIQNCLVARLAQSLTLGAHTYSIDPTNVYTLTTQKRGWPLLELLWKQVTKDELYRRWDAIMTKCYGMSFFVN